MKQHGVRLLTVVAPTAQDFQTCNLRAVQLVNQEYWDISNLEVTNTPELDNLEGYKKPGDAQRAGY